MTSVITHLLKSSKMILQINTQLFWSKEVRSTQKTNDFLEIEKSNIPFWLWRINQRTYPIWCGDFLQSSPSVIHYFLSFAQTTAQNKERNLPQSVPHENWLDKIWKGIFWVPRSTSRRVGRFCSLLRFFTSLLHSMVMKYAFGSFSSGKMFRPPFHNLNITHPKLQVRVVYILWTFATILYNLNVGTSYSKMPQFSVQEIILMY